MTHERAPLALFGPEVSAALRALLEERVIGLHTATVPTAYAGGELQLVLGAAIPADSIVAAPRLIAPAIDGVPSDRNGFVRCQADGSVLGLAAVYAAGDAVLPSEALPSIYRVFAASWASGHRPRVKCKRSPKWKKTGGIRANSEAWTVRPSSRAARARGSSCGWSSSWRGSPSSSASPF